MTEFRVLDESAMRALIERLESAGWPLEFERAEPFATHMGWELNRPLGGRTGLPINLDSFRLGNLSGQISRVQFHVTDALNPRVPAHKRLVDDAVPGLVSALSSILGSPPHDHWSGSGVVWRRPHGEWRLSPGRGSVTLSFAADVAARVDRRLAELGADPDRDIAEQL